MLQKSPEEFQWVNAPFKVFFKSFSGWDFPDQAHELGMS